MSIPQLALNRRAFNLAEESIRFADEWRIAARSLANGGRVLDFGVEAEGSLAAGLALARICMSGLSEVSIVPGDIGGVAWPHVLVTTDAPVAACLLSQYAGWQIAAGKYFAMGSGPMRAAAASEDLFERLGYREPADCAVGVLETSRLPDEAAFAFIAGKTGIDPAATLLLAARTGSLAGTVQIVARSVETALHKLLELGFDVARIKSAYGTAPLAPVADDDLAAIGRTNDAILCGAQVVLWVRGDDQSLAAIGPRVPASGSTAYGKPFLEIFEGAGRDFYKIDPLLFSPAEVTFQNLDTGSVHRFGKTAPNVLRASFGLG
jgi:methenyltetrahydromethanopterin cyclohydrolase